MTPSKIRLMRQRRRSGSGDLYSASGLHAFTHREEDLARLVEHTGEIATILRHLPDFAELCDYGWAADPESYDLAIEAAYQRRLLMMLGKYWVESTDRSGLPDTLSRLVVVQEFITAVGLFSPRICPAAAGWRTISIPASFNDLSIWVFAGLRCWVAAQLNIDQADDGGWALVGTAVPQRPPRPFEHVVTYELMARCLAECGRDRELWGTNAALLIREQIIAPHAPTGELDGDGLQTFERDAAYMVTEFALAHELGHAIAGHDAQQAATDQAAMAREGEADRIALLLLAMSSSSRMFGPNETLLVPWVQAAAALAFFDGLINARTKLLDGLLRRGATGETVRLVIEERSRAAEARLALVGLLRTLVKDGQRPAAQYVANLVDNFNAFLRDVRESIALLSLSQIQKAINVAEQCRGTHV